MSLFAAPKLTGKRAATSAVANASREGDDDEEDELVELVPDTAAAVDVHGNGQPLTPSDDDLVTDPDREAADLAIIEEVVKDLKGNILDDAEHHTACFAVTKVSLSVLMRRFTPCLQSLI